MTLSDQLNQFYKTNNLPVEGGFFEDTFNMDFYFFKATFPNPQYRKDVIHIHDLQHVLYEKDVSWKGEAFIAGWEVSTKLWKYPLIGMMSLWAMGLCWFLYPKSVLEGYKEGLKCTGIIDLKLPKEELLQFTKEALEKKLLKNNTVKMNFFQWMILGFWVLVSEFVFLFPLIIVFSILVLFF